MIRRAGPACPLRPLRILPDLLLLLALAACGGAAPTAVQPAQAGWQFGATMPHPRSEMPAVEIAAVIYVPGGFSGPVGTDDLQAYDIAGDRWGGRAPMPAGRHHLMAAAYQGSLYVFGGSAAVGWSATDSVWRYDPATDTWEELADMPEPRMAGAAVTLGNTIFIVGGTGGSEQLLAFDPDRRSWEAFPGPRQPREHTAAVAYQGELWVIGGRWSEVGELRSVEIYDPLGATWRDGPELRTARAGFAAEVVGEHILAAGGEVILTGREALASLELFDPEIERWVEGPDLPYPVHGVDGVGYLGHFYLLGGSDRPAGIRNEGRVQIYAP